MSALELPWLAIPGNHDRHAEMRSAFVGTDWMPESGPIQWLRDFGPFVVIGLDTLLDGAHHGMLSDEGFAFVDRTLTALGERPVIVATHHPWMFSGISAMDADNLRNGAALMDRLQVHPGPVRMISGHVHRAMTTHIGKVICQIAPSTAHAVHRDVRADAVNSLILEPGAVMLHTWLEGSPSGLVSDILPIGRFAGPCPSEGGMNDDRRRIDISKGPADGNAAPRSSMIVILARYRRAATASRPIPHRQNGNWTPNANQFTSRFAGYSLM